jgi:glycerol-3-phosphate dehydrogenase (NAD(P)+)
MSEPEISKVAVIGAGSWGTTLANLLVEQGCHVDLWVREEEVYHQIKDDHINNKFLQDMPLDRRLNPVRSYEEALTDKELVLVVVPSHVFREVLNHMKPHLRPETALMTANKGIENESLLTMSHVAEEVLPKEYMHRYACLAGPSFAMEVYQKHPTAVTIGCRDKSHGERIQRLFYSESFRVYLSQDVIGIELGGALKNVIAIAAGTATGLNFGYNSLAALMTRGLAEITRLGVAMGAMPLTFAGLAGMGDLVLTCTGELSRNRTVGVKIGQGMKLDEIVNSMDMVAEGVKTSVSAYNLGKKMGVDMPIISEVYQILYHGKDPKQAVIDVMTRELKPELDP